MIASTSPLRTVWPSRKRISMIVPATCGLTTEVAVGVTVPSASIVTGRSAAAALAVPTVVACPPPLPPPSAPAEPPSPPFGSASAS